jgi:outer membrane scaffolding protein for murein synthesis (MipA/OmpV family)
MHTTAPTLLPGGLRARRAATALAAALLPALAAHAQPTPPLWEAGVFVGGATQPAYPGADDRTSRAALLPYLIYRGPLLRIDDDGAMLRALRTPRLELNLGVSGALGSSADASDARAGMPAIGTLIEAGPRLVWNLVEPDARGRAAWRLELPLRAALDLEDRLHYRGLVFSPELVHERRLGGGWNAGLRFGPVFGNERLADLFYQVDARYATPTRPVYDARGGLIAWRTGGSLRRQLHRDVSVFAFASVDSLAGATNRHSPLVERQLGFSAGIGLAWSLLRSAQPAAD